MMLAAGLRLVKFLATASAYVLSAVIVLLFLFLCINDRIIDSGQHQRYINDLHQIQELDARINQNLLQTRLGLLPDFDPIGNEVVQLKQIQADLKQIPAFIKPDGREAINRAIKSYIQVYQQKEKQIEQVKAIAHTRMILEQSPQVNRLAISIFVLATRDRGENIAQAYYSAYQQSLDSANRYRLGLYLLSEAIVLWIAVSIISRFRDFARASQQSESKLRAVFDNSQINSFQVSQFLPHISHELRTPLSVILGCTQLLNRSPSLQPKQQEYIDMISRSGEQLLTLISDVLEMTKSEVNQNTLNEKDFNLHYQLDGLEQMFHFKATSKGLQFIVKRSPDLPEYICADESKLRQVLLNLIGNVVQFTQQGSVTLRITTGDGEDLILDTPTLFFEISAKSGLEHIFEPFVQTETGCKSQEGTGLGLAISYQFVQLMGGNLTFDSCLGKGSCFRFYIPIQNKNEKIPSTSILDPSSLEVMPPEWVEQMNQAAICVNAKLLHHLLEQIPPSHATVKNAIAHLIDNFQFEEIISLTRQENRSSKQ